jgi:hypothetical protein
MDVSKNPRTGRGGGVSEGETMNREIHFFDA